MYRNIPDDVFDLLWFFDGEYKNWESYEDIKGLFGNYEPSMIFKDYPVIENENNSIVEFPDYYPNYRDLSSKQRGVYFDFLRDIYNSSFHIGYVFLFYYGLERYLFRGEKFEEAFDTIIKLRNTHQNSSFQKYSANSLLFSALKYERQDLVRKFILFNNDSPFFSYNVLFFVIYKLQMPLTAHVIMDTSSFFGYKNEKFIKNNQDLFLQELKAEMAERFGSDEILISDLISQEEMNELNEKFEFVYANPTLEEREIYIPDISADLDFKNEIYGLLINVEKSIKLKK